MEVKRRHVHLRQQIAVGKHLRNSRFRQRCLATIHFHIGELLTIPEHTVEGCNLISVPRTDIHRPELKENRQISIKHLFS